jgi:TPR repeat protein
MHLVIIIKYIMRKTYLLLLLCLAPGLFASNADDLISEMKKKAVSGDTPSQYKLGEAYKEGILVSKDYAESRKWFLMASDYGVAAARWEIGIMYLKGEGVPMDYVESYAWFNLSVAGGYEFARQFRDGTAKRLMTPEQVARGQSRSTELFKEIEAKREKRK